MKNYVHVIFLMSTLCSFTKLEDVNSKIVWEPDNWKRKENTGTETYFGTNRNENTNEMILKNSTFEKKKEESGTESKFISFVKNVLKINYGHQIPTYHLSVLIALDESFVNYHQGLDYQTYILTNMNMAAETFVDITLGVRIELTVAKIYVMGKEGENFRCKSYKEALENFCKWSKEFKVYYPDYDVAMLVTREPFVNSSDALFGVTYPASVCDYDRACIVMRDTGLNTGVQISRLLGRQLGLQSDDGKDGRCLPEAIVAFDDEKVVFHHIMAPTISFSRLTWSVCSRTAIEKFFSSSKGWCLNENKVKKMFYEYPKMLAGSMYDIDFQCFVSYPASKAVKGDPIDFCLVVFCTDSSNNFAKTIEPAPGTSCGKDKWCFNGECVHLGYRPRAVNGKWSDWLPWSECSRTCGGGIQISQRFCNNPPTAFGGHPCFGSAYRERTCNIMDCDSSQPQFREVQCAQFNNVSVNGTFYKWRPLLTYISEDRCGLYCLNENDKLARLKSNAEDGTPCRVGTNDRCINGVCTKIGCDWVVNSEAVEDRCGVCGGDGSSCQRVQGWANGTGPTVLNHTLILTIPAKSRFIELYQAVPTNKRFLFQMVTPKDSIKNAFLNTIFLQKRNAAIFYVGTNRCKRIKAVINGPTFFDINVFMENGGNATPVYYSYMALKKNPFMLTKLLKGEIRLPASKAIYNNNFNWEYLGWTKCTSRCEGGTQISKSKCVSIWYGVVSNFYCSGIENLETLQRACNLQPCSFKWRTGPWTVVNKESDLPIEIRELYCMREPRYHNQPDVYVSAKYCEHIERPSRLRFPLSKIKETPSPKTKHKYITKHKHKSKHKQKMVKTKIKNANFQMPKPLEHNKTKIKNSNFQKQKPLEHEKTKTKNANFQKLKPLEHDKIKTKNANFQKLKPLEHNKTTEEEKILAKLNKKIAYLNKKIAHLTKISSHHRNQTLSKQNKCKKNKHKQQKKLKDNNMHVRIYFNGESGILDPPIEDKTIKTDSKENSISHTNKTNTHMRIYFNGESGIIDPPIEDKTIKTDSNEKSISHTNKTNKHMHQDLTLGFIADRIKNDEAPLAEKLNSIGTDATAKTPSISTEFPNVILGSTTKMILSNVSKIGLENNKRKRHISVPDILVKTLLATKNHTDSKGSSVQNCSMYKIKDIKKTLYIVDSMPHNNCSKHFVVISVDEAVGCILVKNFNKISIGLRIDRYCYRVKSSKDKEKAMKCYEEIIRALMEIEKKDKIAGKKTLFKKIGLALRKRGKERQKQKKYRKYRRNFLKLYGNKNFNDESFDQLSTNKTNMEFQNCKNISGSIDNHTFEEVTTEVLLNCNNISGTIHNDTFGEITTELLPECNNESDTIDNDTSEELTTKLLPECNNINDTIDNDTSEGLPECKTTIGSINNDTFEGSTTELLPKCNNISDTIDNDTSKGLTTKLLPKCNSNGSINNDTFARLTTEPFDPKLSDFTNNTKFREVITKPIEKERVYHLRPFKQMQVEKCINITKENIPCNASFRFSFTIDTKNLKCPNKNRGRHRMKTIEPKTKNTKNVHYYDVKKEKDTYLVEPCFRSCRNVFLIVSVDNKAYHKLCKVLKSGTDIFLGSEALKYKFIRKQIKAKSG